MRRINTPEQLKGLARELGMRPDWHEPDEREVTARTYGTSFDNAGMWPMEEAFRYSNPDERSVEMYVVLYRQVENSNPGHPVTVACVNLADLFAWACGWPGSD